MPAKKKKPDLSKIFTEDDDFEESVTDEEEEPEDEDLEDEENDFDDPEEDDDDSDEEEEPDEDDEVEPEEEEKPPRKKSRKRKTTPSTPKKSKKATGSLSLDYGELDSSVLKVAPSGTVDSRFPINRYKASKGRKDRIAILKEQVLIAKVHYVEGYGYFHCFGGVCCEQNGFPSTRYIYPIVRYDTSSKGKVVSADYEIQFLDLPHDKYEAQILPMVEDDEDITAVDFRITCTATDFQKFLLHALKNLYWKTDKFDSAQIIADAQKLLKHIPITVAKTITEVEYERDVLGQGKIDDDDEDDYDDIDDL